MIPPAGMCPLPARSARSQSTEPFSLSGVPISSQSPAVSVRAVPSSPRVTFPDRFSGQAVQAAVSVMPRLPRSISLVLGAVLRCHRQVAASSRQSPVQTQRGNCPAPFEVQRFPVPTIYRTSPVLRTRYGWVARTGRHIKLATLVIKPILPGISSKRLDQTAALVIKAETFEDLNTLNLWQGMWRTKLYPRSLSNSRAFSLFSYALTPN